MKKIFTLFLSTILCTTSPVFAMDPTDESQQESRRSSFSAHYQTYQTPTELIEDLQKQPTDLKEISWNLAPLNDEVLKNLTSFTNLEHLDLESNAWRMDLPLYQNEMSLEELKSNAIPYHIITDDGLAHLKGLTKLTSLALENDECITDKGLKHLESLKNLESLWLGSISGLHIKSGVTTEGLVNLLHKLPNLKNLGLHYMNHIDYNSLWTVNKKLIISA